MPYQMHNGKWRGKKMIDGVVRTKTFNSKREAKKWEVQQTIEEWQNPVQPTLTALDWANAHLDFAQSRHVPKVYDAKHLAFRRLFAFIPTGMLMSDITPAHAMHVLQQVAREASSGPANTMRKHLSAAWEWGIRYLDIPRDNPFMLIDRLPADQHPRRVPTEAEYWQVFNAASPKDKVLLLTALHTAARKGELYALLWSDIDFDGRKIRLGTRKRAGGGMEYNWIPMTQELHNSLLHYRGTEDGMRSMYVFSSATGEPYRNRFSFMPNLCAKAGVTPHFGLHAIRHLSASMLAQAGISIPSIQTILRHKKATTTDLYIRNLGIQSMAIDNAFPAIPAG
ncbi:MAG: tyrosine-type recombinase/integrase [Desulfovibrio sp.]